MSDHHAQAYWSRNIRIVGWLLAVWFLVSFGCGILFVEALDGIRLWGFKLGFWMAQQGAIYVFVVLIYLYIRLMDRLDAEFEATKRSQDEGLEP